MHYEVNDRIVNENTGEAGTVVNISHSNELVQVTYDDGSNYWSPAAHLVYEGEIGEEDDVLGYDDMDSVFWAAFLPVQRFAA